MRRIVIRQFYGDADAPTNYILFPPSRPGAHNTSFGFDRMVPIIWENGPFERLLQDAINEWALWDSGAWIISQTVMDFNPKTGKPWKASDLPTFNEDQIGANW